MLTLTTREEREGAVGHAHHTHTQPVSLTLQHTHTQASETHALSSAAYQPLNIHIETVISKEGEGAWGGTNVGRSRHTPHTLLTQSR